VFRQLKIFRFGKYSESRIKLYGLYGEVAILSISVLANLLFIRSLRIAHTLHASLHVRGHRTGQAAPNEIRPPHAI
jgi:hypothetical protein